jgi:hypothetical protein
MGSQEVDRILNLAKSPIPCRASPHSDNLNGMNTELLPQPVKMPRHLGRAEVAQLLSKILRHQEILVNDICELFNSLGYRIDLQDENMGIIRNRLWAIEHKAKGGGNE